MSQSHISRVATLLFAFFSFLPQTFPHSIARVNGLSHDEEPQTKSVQVPGEDLWSEFRKSFPYHIQTLAYEKRSRTLIITEPPPHVTKENLKEALQRYNPSLNPQIYDETHKVGVDGWVKDLLLQLPPMSEAQTRDAIDAIQQHLFHTTYKADVLPLPVQKSPPYSGSLDLNVSIAEIRQWLFVENEHFSPLLGGTPQTANELITNRRSGVFLSKDRGLVIWSVNRKKPISNYQIEARQFALDSDILVGAINVEDQILILGRERIIPVNILPPLRTETIMLLASVKGDELAQSYERNHIFAGRFNGKDDWAPIYLSDALIDTEYGSLLNITDQLLKSWSNNGKIRYANFETYPEPLSWSKNWCFDSPLMIKALTEKRALSVTFNWNTKGVGYTTRIDGREFFALNRSGSLPTSYLVGEDETNVNEYEEAGYRWFATVGDPNLARVVQYAALYQIFWQYPVRGDLSFVKKPIAPRRDVLTENATIALNSFAQLTILHAEDVTIPPKVREKLASYRDDLIPIIGAYGQAGVRALSRALAHPRLSEAEEQELNRLIRGLRASGAGANSIGQSLLSLPREKQIKVLAYFISKSLLEDEIAKVLLLESANLDINKIKNDYVAASRRDSASWIRTPSVVVSHVDVSGDSDQLRNYVGGHSLKATTTRFEPNVEVTQGSLRVSQKGSRILYEFNPADIAKLQRLVRDAAAMTEGKAITTEVLNSVKRRLETDLRPPPPPIRLRNTAFLNPAQPPASRGFDGGKSNGWRPEAATKVIPAEATDSARYGDVALIIDREITTEGFSFTITTADGRVIKALSTPAAVDAVVGLERSAAKDNPKVAFHLKGFTADEAQGFLYNAELRLKNNELVAFAKQGDSPAYRGKVADYNLPGVNIGEHSIKQISDGPHSGRYELTINFDVPSRVTTAPLRVRLQMLFRNFISTQRIAGLKQAITNTLKKPVSADSTMNGVIVDLANELRVLNPRAKDILTIWKEDTSGIFILELRPARTNGYSREKSDAE